MNKLSLRSMLKYIIGPIVLGIVLSLSIIKLPGIIIPAIQALTNPVTFTDGSVLTAAQLNSVNNTIYNGFNAHNHDGGDGEPSTLAFTNSTAAFNQGADITFNGSGASLECDGTTATDVFIDQNDRGVNIGSGTLTSDVTTARQVLLNANTGDASLRLQVNNTSANAWDIFNDNSDSDNLEMSYNGAASALSVLTTGSIVVADDVTVGNASSSDSETIEIQAGTSQSARLRLTETGASNSWDFGTATNGSDLRIITTATTGTRTFTIFGNSAAIINLTIDGEISLTGNSTFDIGDTEIAEATTPAANKIYPNTIPKAWANTTSAGAINDGVGLSLSGAGGGTYPYTFATAFESTSSMACTCTVAGATAGYCTVSNNSTSTMTVTTFNSGGSAAVAAHFVNCLGEN